MKKNFKLFSTIASLCLAVALMAFGVWAATSVTFKTNSSVKFTATTDVFGTFHAEVKLNDGAASDVIEYQKVNAAGSDWVATANNKADKKDALLGDGAQLGAAELPLTAVNDMYTFTYSFTNAAPYAIKYTVTTAEFQNIKTANAPEADGIAITDVATKTGSTAVGATTTWTITVKLLSLDIAETAVINVPFALVLEKA